MERSRFGTLVAALVLLASMGTAQAQDRPRNELDPSPQQVGIEEKPCGDAANGTAACSESALELGRQPGRRVRTFGDVTAELPSRLRADCDVDADDVGWPVEWIRCFDKADTEQSEWLTQGIGGTGEWRTGETPGGGHHWLVATWCWRGSEGIDEADVCNRDEKIKRTRISLISVARNGYRNVELVEPYLQRSPEKEPVISSRGILLHAGGAAIAGPWLYVADTDWLYVFNLNHFVEESSGVYQLPVWDRYVIDDPGIREKSNPFSSISVDGSGDRPRLVAAEYRLDNDDDALVTAWPLKPDGRLPTDEFPLRSIGAWTIAGDTDIDRVQGVAARGDTFLFAEGADTIERAPAGRARPQTGHCIRWGRGNGEDLYAAPGQDVVVGINEGFLATGSAFWAVSYRQAFGLAAPPPGRPTHDC